MLALPSDERHFLAHDQHVFLYLPVKPKPHPQSAIG
jgi:hypothetical protein